MHEYYLDVVIVTEGDTDGSIEFDLQWDLTKL
jgi:hypothetical protein